MPRKTPSSRPRTDLTKKPVGIWIRVSTETQAKGDSPKHHEARAIGYAKNFGWEVVETYHLEGVSGKSVREHPEAQRMLRDVAAGRITGLVFSKLARLARNTKELLEFSDYFSEYEADLISLDESIDTSTAPGRLFFTIIAAMATWEREEIGSRISATSRIRAEQGKPTGGPAQLGYRWVDKRLIIDPKEAPVRKMMYDLFLEHGRLKTVARILNEQGHRMRTGSKFTDTTVKRLLADPITRGKRRANVTRRTRNGQQMPLPKSEWVWQDVEPLVSEAVWKQVNAILTERSVNRKPRTRKTVHLFSGLMFCRCGKGKRVEFRKMYVPSSSPKYTCQACRNKIPVEEAEDLFREHVEQFLHSKERLDNAFRKSDESLARREGEVAALEHERARVQSSIDEAFKLYHEKRISGEGFQKRNDPLEERINQIDKVLPRLSGSLEADRMSKLSRDELVKEALDLQANWDNLTFEQKRTVVETIVEKILVDPETIEFKLRYLPFDPKQNATKRQQNP